MIPIQPLIDAATPNSTIVLSPGEYDDALPVIINKNIKLQGPREAVIHSEFQLYNASVGFDGLKFQMNKVGAAQKTGIGSPYPQNGMITALNAILWMDDCSMVSLPGFSKPAYHSVNSFANIRSRTKLSNIDWRGNDAQVIELLYNSYANIFDTTGQNVTFGVASQTSAANGAAISCAGSDLILSGAYVYKFGTSNVGVTVARKGYCQVGAGVYTWIGFPTPVQLDATSTKYVAPGSVG